MDTQSGRVYTTPEAIEAAIARGEDVVPISPSLAERMQALNEYAPHDIGPEEWAKKRAQLKSLSRMSARR